MRALYLLTSCCGLMLSCNSSNRELQTAFNENASISTTNINPLNGIPINTFVNPEAHTTSTLYGNETAIQYVRTRDDGNYPKDAVLSLVTWKQKSDPRWFGANIADTVLKVEILTFNDSLRYRCYAGKDMKLSAYSPADSAVQWIRSQRSIILP